MSVVENLEAAKNELIENGWVQEAYQYGKKHCIIGAIAEVKDADAVGSESCQEVLTVERAIGWDRAGKGDWSIAAWNDDPGRTFLDVMDALDAAILRAKEEESSPT